MRNEKLTVKRIINNNIVIAENFKGQELIAIGKGLGFTKNKFDVIYPHEVSKTYVLVDNASRTQLLNLFYEVPYEVIEVTQKIIDMAQEDLKTKFNVNLIIALADHIHFSVAQFKAGNSIPVLVDEEVKRFYRNEYQVGKKAVEMINRSLDVSLRKEEASSIAFHLITATENKSNHEALKIMAGVKGIVGVVENELGLSLDEESLAYSRFIVHLKFFMRRVFSEQAGSTQSLLAPLLSQVRDGYEQANRCVDKISAYMAEEYRYRINDDERLYLVIHLICLLDYHNRK